MRRRFERAALAAMLAGSAIGCADPKLKKEASAAIERAKAAVAAAATAAAGKPAPAGLAEARDALAQAERSFKSGGFDAAKREAAGASWAAEKALEAAKTPPKGKKAKKQEKTAKTSPAR